MRSWSRDWFDVLTPAGEILLILIVVWLLQRSGIAFLRRLHARYQLPMELVIGGRRLLRVILYTAATIFILQRIGVSGTMLWTALTGFAAVAAVAFFAAWSVLSNIFCSLLIFTTRLFRLNDLVELIESYDKPGLKGRVVDINLIFTTLEETSTSAEPAGTMLRIPNNLFFQRVLRRTSGTGAWTNTFGVTTGAKVEPDGV